MAIKRLNFNNLPNDKHLGAAGQIWDIVKDLSVPAFPLLGQCMTEFHNCEQNEDAAWRRSPKDFTSDDMKNADNMRDDYVSAGRTIIYGYTLLPDESPMKRLALEAYQVFKDYNFSTGDSYTGESTKLDNMWQVFTTMQERLEQMGVWNILETAMTYNQQVKDYFRTRIENLAERVIGEMRDARAATDQAYQNLCEVLDAVNLLGSTPETQAAERQLNALVDYYKQYYMKPGTQGGSGGNSGSGSGSGSNGNNGNDEGGQQGGGTNTGGDEGGGQQGGGTDPVNPNPGTGGGGGGADPDDPTNDED